MKILYITAHRPRPFGGGAPIRSFHILDALSRNHELVVALAKHSSAEIEKFMGDQETSWHRLVVSRPKRSLLNRIPGMLFGTYRHSLRCKNRNMYHEDLVRWVAEVKPDLIWYYQSQSFWHTGHITGIPCVYDMDDLDSIKQARQLRYKPLCKRIAGAIDSFSFRRAERGLMNSADIVSISNPNDVPSVKSLTRSRVMHLSNGFDFAKEPLIAPRRSNRIIFYGAMGYQPTGEGLLWFCDEIWPLIRNAAPDTMLDAVGRYDKFTERIGSLPGVTLHGYVNDMGPLINQSAFLVVPLRIGSGTRIKILEAWARGIPVVSTSVGCEGLGAVDGVNLLIGDSPERFAEQCLKLLKEPELGARLAREAYDYAKERFDWSVIYPIVDQAVELASSKI